MWIELVSKMTGPHDPWLPWVPVPCHPNGKKLQELGEESFHMDPPIPSLFSWLDNPTIDFFYDSCVLSISTYVYMYIYTYTFAYVNIWGFPKS